VNKLWFRTYRIGLWGVFGLILWALHSAAAQGGGVLGNVGTFPKWSKVEIVLMGPDSIGMSNTDNPFQVVVDVTFTGPSGQTFVVPAFYDGNGAGGLNGDVWKVRFSPNASGTWSFISASADPLLDNYSGTFEVTDAVGCTPYQPGTLPNFLCVGRLEYVGERYLKFADGPYWLKGGVDDPEDFLAPSAQTGFATKNLAIDFLAGRRANSLYMMLHNTGNEADGQNVWPWVGSTQTLAQLNHRHFDVGKLESWEQTFSYLQQQGIVLHLVLQDDSGWTGFDHALYYRQMVARFAHHNALIWNISEEYQENYTADEVKANADSIRSLDAYRHPITVHHNGSLASWEPFIGDDRFDITSYQSELTPVPQNDKAITWLDNIALSGRVIPISFDETGVIGPNDRALARHIGWSVYMGGANFELHSFPLTLYQVYSNHYADMTLARTFIESLPFWQMVPSNALLVSGQGYLLADPGNVYAVYLPEGGDISIDLAGGTYFTAWLNPITGDITTDAPVSGGSTQDFSPPFADDAVLYVGLNPLGFNYTPPPFVPIPQPELSDPNASFPSSNVNTNLILAMSVQPPFALPGETVTWNITVNNPANAPITNVTLTNLVPSELNILSTAATSGTANITGQMANFILDVLHPGETVTIAIITRISSDIQIPFSIVSTVSSGNVTASDTLLSASQLPVTGQKSKLLRIRLFVVSGAIGCTWLLLGIYGRHRVNRWRYGL
jgi:uncharacterized repeat protein (TIGR01451 family)